ncbi:MAG TPA: BTAD domain-containing putative transcriptional regulator [Gemmatimonadaceae bacterium]|nr:BTAD domain-containing putative transcriptional regulator [Gemmatimonadaceae bacterium]
MLNLRLLGAMDITGADPRAQSTDALLSQPKRAALLVYLSIGAPTGRFHRRDALLNLFWPDLDDAHGRHALNQSLYFLRERLGRGVIVNRGNEEVGVNPAQMTSDVAQLRDFLAADQPEQALSLYQGPLLPGFHAQELNDFQDWLDAQRRALAEAVLNAALTLSTLAERDNNFAEAVHWARRGCEISPLDENCRQQLLRLLMLHGNVAAARAEYARFAERLRSELDADPDDATRLILDTPVKTKSAVIESAPAQRPAIEASPATQSPPLRRDAAPTPNISRKASRVTVAVVVMTVAAFATIAARRVFKDGALTLARDAGRHPTILVADFTGPASDTGLGSVATQLALIALQDSRTARAVWSGEETATLERMKIRVGTPIRDSIAREVAVREGYAAVLQGFVRDSHGALLVGVSVVEPTTNHVMFMQTSTASNAGALTEAVDDLMRSTRRRIGDARDAITNTRPLEQVTTSSLEALRALSAARRHTVYDRRTRIALLEHAISLDTSFAAAYRSLGVDLYWANQRERSSEMLRKAVQHSDRLSDTEREIASATLYAKGRYYDPVRALAAFNAILARDPTDFTAFDNKIWMLMQLREYDLAARLIGGGQVVVKAKTPTVYMEFGMLARASFLAGRPQEGWRAIEAGVARDPRMYTLRAGAYQLSGRLDSAEADIERALALSSDQDRMLNREIAAQRRASMARRGGHLEAAHRFDDERMRIATTNQDARATALALVPRLRESARILHRPDLVRNDLPKLRRLVESLHGVDRPVPSLAITYVDAGDPKTAAMLLRDMEKTIAPGEWPEVVARIHEAWARVALAEGRAADAVSELRKADIGSCSMCLLPDFSIAYEQAGQVDSAIATGERYLATIDGLATTYDGHYRPMLEHRLGRLYLKRGDKVNAARHLNAFIDMWRDADPVLAPSVDSARRELARPRPRRHGRAL